MIIKSTNNIAWLHDNTRLQLNVPCLDTYGVKHIAKKQFKADNYKRFISLPYDRQKYLIIKMLAQKGGAATTSAKDEYYNTFDITKYHGNIFYGGLDLGININKLACNVNVNSIVVVELQQELIDLVSPLISKSNKIKIYKGNPLKFFPEAKYNYMIWTDYQFWLHDDGDVAVIHNYIKQQNII